MNHLLISREYPPAAYPHGGIGTYVAHVSRLLAERGETVHVIAELWDGASQPREVRYGGRLVIHRVALSRALSQPRQDQPILDGMAASEFPAQAFAWQSARAAERLIDEAAIDVVEAQDYEAPLYYFLLRRSLGLGPDRRPPCIVHLHSPWEFVRRGNGWHAASPYDATLTRLEAHAICAADAWLCPSRFLAAQAASRFGIDRDAIECIPYPVGDTPFVQRSPEVWRTGTICYVGRLEPRKGVLEWTEAAVSAAAERPELRFEFVGADTSLDGLLEGRSVRSALRQRVPPPLAHQFAFHDAEPQPALWSRLERSQLVVVPSRWENFPHTGIEAMCTGLPVLASPHGGMTEMIEDGRTGWLSASNRPDDLFATLRRALDTPAEQREAMGREASAAIRRRCDNTQTIARQLAFRERLAHEGARRSIILPRVPSRGASWSSSRVSPDANRVGSPARGGVAIVVVDRGGGNLRGCVSSLLRQTRPPSSVAVIAARSEVDSCRSQILNQGWQIEDSDDPPVEARGSAALRIALAQAPLGVALIDPNWELETAFVEACETTLARDERIAVVSSWPQDRHRVRIRPPAALPHQWVADDVAECAVYRADAVSRISGELDGLPAGADLALRLLLDGWLAVTYPACLCRRLSGPDNSVVGRSWRAAMVEREPDILAAELPELVELLAGNVGDMGRQAPRGAFSPAAIWREPLAVQIELLRRAVRHPRYAASWLGWHGRRVWHNLTQRLRRPVGR